jgi:RNA recognition motif-containing protein
MTDDAAAKTAIAALNGAELNGRAIHVNAARPQLYRNSGKARTINDQNGSLPIQS